MIISTRGAQAGWDLAQRVATQHGDQLRPGSIHFGAPRYDPGRWIL